MKPLTTIYFLSQPDFLEISYIFFSAFPALSLRKTALGEKVSFSRYSALQNYRRKKRGKVPIMCLHGDGLKFRCLPSLN